MPDSKRFVDIHCHIFNVRQLARELLVLLFPRLYEFSPKEAVRTFHENIIGENAEKPHDTIKNKQYPHVYTDISHFNEDKTINYVNQLLDDEPELAGKIMYGSDFVILMLKENSFDEYPSRSVCRNQNYVKVTRSHYFVGYKLSWVRQNGAGLFSPAFLLQNLARKTRRREKIA
jgi:hypothetical protein